MLGKWPSPNPARVGEGVGPLGMELRHTIRHDARGALGGVSHAGRARGRDEARRVRLVRPCVFRWLRAVLLLLAGPWVGRA